MSKYTIGIDNGSTGTLAILGPEGPFFDEVPTKRYLMGKEGKIINRIDVDELKRIICARVLGVDSPTRAASAMAYVERPFTGSPMMINTTVLSARAHEAVLIAMEQLGIGAQTIDSKEWQVPVLGTIKGSAALKLASSLRGRALYPAFAAQINAHGDADGLLIAHHFHRNTK